MDKERIEHIKNNGAAKAIRESIKLRISNLNKNFEGLIVISDYEKLSDSIQRARGILDEMEELLKAHNEINEKLK